MFKFTFGDLLKNHLNRRCRERDEYVLVITDRQNQYSDELRYAHHVAMARSESEAGGCGVVDSRHFTDSQHSPLVQLADLAAFVRRRTCTYPTETDSRLEVVMAELAGAIEAAVPDPKWNFRSVHEHFAKQG